MVSSTLQYRCILANHRVQHRDVSCTRRMQRAHSAFGVFSTGACGPSRDHPSGRRSTYPGRRANRRLKELSNHGDTLVQGGRAARRIRFVMLGGRAPVTAAGNSRWRRSHHPFGRIAIGPDSLGANDPDVSCRDTPAV